MSRPNAWSEGVGLPPVAPWLRNLLLGLFLLYVAELVLLNVGLPVYTLAWQDFGGGFAVWQPLTHWLVQGPRVDGVAFALLAIYFFLPGIADRLGRRNLTEAVVSGGAGGLVLGLIADAVGLGFGPAMGWAPFVFGLTTMFGLTYPQGEVRLFFVLPVKGVWFLWGSLVLALLTWLATLKGLSAVENIGQWLGVFAWWHLRGPGARTRSLRKSGKSVEQNLRRFDVLPGGKQTKPNRDDWIH